LRIASGSFGQASAICVVGRQACIFRPQESIGGDGQDHTALQPLPLRITVNFRRMNFTKRRRADELASESPSAKPPAFSSCAHKAASQGHHGISRTFYPSHALLITVCSAATGNGRHRTARTWDECVLLANGTTKNQ
jgi:hypothetical protein